MEKGCKVEELKRLYSAFTECGSFGIQAFESKVLMKLESARHRLTDYHL